MSDKNISRSEERERIRQRINNNDVEDKQRVVIPAEESKSLADETVQRRVCAYCRVSTDDPAQTTSYELQKKHYEKQISETPGWIFAGIYADEGISATSLKNRDEFNRMIADCYAGKIDVIVTKNVSRFARNVVDCLSVVRNLAKLNPPVGVKFENEGFYSLDSTSELLLTVLAASAQEESKTKSNSMKWSLEKRFDNGNYLTPVLLGYDHDEEGNLIVNQAEANTVKLMYYSFLAGFSLTDTARLLNELDRPSKKGNVKWNASAVRNILKNERYCGDILTWKTYTYDFWEHKKRKNKRNRRQVWEKDHHEPIVSREIWDAVQIKLELDKYSSDPHSFPTLNVVDDGILKGFVSVNRSCRGFTEADYCNASRSLYTNESENDVPRKQDLAGGRPPNGSFELDGYEIARAQFFALTEKPVMTINNKKVSFNTMCLKKFEDVEFVELLINSVEKCIAIRPCSEDSPNAFRWGKIKEDRWRSTPRSITGFAPALFAITGWDPSDRVKLCGQYLSDGHTQMLLFDISEPEIIRLVRDEAAEMAAEAEADVKNRENVGDESVDTDEKVTETGADDAVEFVKPEKILPESWKSSFGSRVGRQETWYYDLIQYEGDWDILRPAKRFAIAGGVSEVVLKEVERETHKIIKELRCAV